jgi:hypothetical protein
MTDELPKDFYLMAGSNDCYVNRAHTLAVAFPSSDRDYIEFFRYKLGWFIVDRDDYLKIIQLLDFI